MLVTVIPRGLRGLTMSLQEYTVNKDTGHVPEAHVDMGRGQVDEIERQAKATVTTAKEEGGRVSQAESQIAGVAHGNSESKLYGDSGRHAWKRFREKPGRHGPRIRTHCG